MARVSGSSGVSESSIVFYNGGHNHDGISSSLIDTDEYSLYDWTVGYVGAGSRLSRQEANFDALKNVIANVVTETVLGPTGIRLAPNSLHAISIVSNTITADQLAANIVLVNNIIRSNNYVANTSGWAIYGNGFAEFDIAVIRGQIVADSIYINALNYWNSNGTFSVGAANNYMFYNGTNLELTGTVTATAGQIAGWEISGDSLITGGNFSGDMILGKVLGSNFAGMKVDGAAAGGLFPRAVVTEGVVNLSSVYQGNSGIASSTVYTDSGVIYENYGNQTFEFYYDAGADQLWAYINGQPYCIQKCGASPPAVGSPPDPVSPVGSPPDPVSPVVSPVVSPGVDVVAPPPVSPPSGCVPPCPDGFFCIDNSYCIG